MQKVRLPDHIKTLRLLLRRFVPFDLSSYEVLCNANTREFGLYGDVDFYQEHYTRDQIQKELDEIISDFAENRAFKYAIVLSGELIGAITIRNICWGADNCILGYFLGRAHWGQGLMSEALQGLENCLRQIGFNRIDARVNVGNVRSIALVERNGYRREGVLHAASRHLVDIEAGRAYSDMAVYAKFLKEPAPGES